MADAVLCLTGAGGRWRTLPADFPPLGNRVVLLPPLAVGGRPGTGPARVENGQNPWPAAVVMDGRQVEDDRSGRARGSDGHEGIDVRRRQIPPDANGSSVACPVQPAGVPDRPTARALKVWLAPSWPGPRTVVAGAGRESGALADHLTHHEGWTPRIVERPRPGFEVTGPNRIVERTLARLGRHRRLSEDHGLHVRTSEELVTVAARVLTPRRLAPGRISTHPPRSLAGTLGTG